MLVQLSLVEVTMGFLIDESMALSFDHGPKLRPSHAHDEMNTDNRFLWQQNSRRYLMVLAAESATPCLVDPVEIFSHVDPRQSSHGQGSTWKSTPR